MYNCGQHKDLSVEVAIVMVSLQVADCIPINIPYLEGSALYARVHKMESALYGLHIMNYKMQYALLFRVNSNSTCETMTIFAEMTVYSLSIRC